MEMLRVILFLLVLILIVWSRDIQIVGRDGENEETVECSFSESGRYTLINLNNLSTTVTFDRLTNSRVALPPHVKQLIIRSSRFDSLSPCDHVESAIDLVVTLEDRGSNSQCVTMTSSVTQKVQASLTTANQHLSGLKTETSSMKTSSTSEHRMPPTENAKTSTLRISATSKAASTSTTRNTENITATTDVPENFTEYIVIGPVTTIIIISLIIIVICIRRRQRTRLRESSSDILFQMEPVSVKVD